MPARAGRPGRSIDRKIPAAATAGHTIAAHRGWGYHDEPREAEADQAKVAGDSLPSNLADSGVINSSAT